jgi:hypothetical protein
MNCTKGCTTFCFRQFLNYIHCLRAITPIFYGRGVSIWGAYMPQMRDNILISLLKEPVFLMVQVVVQMGTGANRENAIRKI